jgi:hypothetical protein
VHCVVESADDLPSCLLADYPMAISIQLEWPSVVTIALIENRKIEQKVKVATLEYKIGTQIAWFIPQSTVEFQYTGYTSTRIITQKTLFSLFFDRSIPLIDSLRVL